MSILIEISIGEFLDKLTILRIKSERVTDPDKLVNIRKELQRLEKKWEETGHQHGSVMRDVQELTSINETLWEIEDRIRRKEREKSFDEEFIELARTVYLTNDRRARIKKSINEKLNSALVEEKFYDDHQRG